ncbi:unnamed protein product [Diabrotica balteata]|uniref:Uncharacterized protein n=1 Tax=Diabrotica balteata TaxID=107213 RepID=A0A9N9SSD8_DIABA|nr:unnamed protein product [Diabrotica balteata]
MYLNIVRGNQLPMFINKKVSITGFVTEKSYNGMWFEIKTTDNVTVRITMKKPIDQHLEGYVEVHGDSTGKGVTADEYIHFSNEKFAAKSHNKLCSYLHSIPTLWNLE